MGGSRDRSWYVGLYVFFVTVRFARIGLDWDESDSGVEGRVGIGMKKLGSCHMEYINYRRKIRSLLRPVDDESTGVMVMSSHC